MAKLRESDVVVSARPSFYLNEPEPNYGDKPRLDILLTMQDDSWVRYHPGPTPIRSDEKLPSFAMQCRLNRVERILKERRDQCEAGLMP